MTCQTRNLLRRLLRDTRGGHTLEYGLVLAFIGIAAVAAVIAFGKKPVKLWTGVNNDVNTALAPEEAEG